MKIPSRLKIKHGVYYKVVWQETIADDPSCMGLTDPNDKIIYIKIGMSNTDISKTLIHEIFHALSFSYDIELPHKTVYALEDAVFRLLKVNKWL